jgi:hypothetical protein
MPDTHTYLGLIMKYGLTEKKKKLLRRLALSAEPGRG